MPSMPETRFYHSMDGLGDNIVFIDSSINFLYSCVWRLQLFNLRQLRELQVRGVGGVPPAAPQEDEPGQLAGQRRPPAARRRLGQEVH